METEEKMKNVLTLIALAVVGEIIVIGLAMVMMI